jgi:hypothetical protein
VTDRAVKEMRTIRDEQGLAGKLTLLWLLVSVVLVVALIDAGSIALTHYHLSSLATNAASDGAAAFGLQHDADAACGAAAATLHSEDSTVKIAKNGCKVDPTTGSLTITVKKQARTILAWRLSFTKKYVMVTDTETNGPPAT